MGDYNPYVPTILGHEWPGIRDEATQFSPAVDVVEYGHTFRTGSAYTLQDARFYINKMLADQDDEVYIAAIYPRGDEAESGPIRKITIPVESVATTGTTVSSSSPSMLIPPGQNYYILDTDVADSFVSFRFNTGQYTILNGKRILDVSLLVGGYRSFGTVERDNGPYTYLANGAHPIFASASLIYDNGGTFPEFLEVSGGGIELYRCSFGDVSYLWNNAPTVGEILPWNYTDLARFDSSAAGTPLYAIIATGTNFVAPANSFVNIWYAALEVTFCEETRSRIGGLHRAASTTIPWVYGANVIRLRDIDRNLNPTLAAGGWTVTLAAANQGALEGGHGYPDLNALRELYALPTHEGVKLNITTTEGETFTRESTNVLPQLSVHASGGPLTEVHVYGRVAAGRVHGSTWVDQVVYDDVVGAGTSYPQIRFYARRFGNTTASLYVSGTGDIAGVAANISVSDFDELPEIVDGWKEVSLEFDTAPTLGGLATPGLRWLAPGETAGNRWEVLGTSAPAASGVPGNLLNLVASPHQLGIATYQPSGGTAAFMSWASPTASGGAIADTTSDVVFLLSQDPPPVLDLTIQTLTQTVTGIGEYCGGTPCCIPTEIYYQHMTWSLPASGAYAIDTYERTEAAGSFGSTDTGQAYSLTGTATDFSVLNGYGRIQPTAAGTNRIARFNVGTALQHALLDVELFSDVTSGTLQGGLIFGYADLNNYLTAKIQSDGTSTSLLLTQRVSGSNTDLGSVALPATDKRWYVEAEIDEDSQVWVRAWPVSVSEVPQWQIRATSTITPGQNIGVVANSSTATTYEVRYYSLYVTPPSTSFGSYELQRSDDITTWQTIMSASSIMTTGFSDFEARVGQTSSYRIRRTNVYGFAGTWSDTVTGAVTSPGVSVQCDDEGTAAGTLIFTSNAVQSGARNLAYVMQFDRNVEEAFAFPEAGTSRLRRRYGRDFFTAFRPTERGGEQFSRTILVQAAAGALPDMANTRSLRDLAWDDLPYVCVRDERGNRWFANVVVPDVNISQRSSYFARIDISEVTDTSCEVDP